MLIGGFVNKIGERLWFVIHFKSLHFSFQVSSFLILTNEYFDTSELRIKNSIYFDDQIARLSTKN